jgi:polar amino acid transport system substrate-binding protein
MRKALFTLAGVAVALVPMTAGAVGSSKTTNSTPTPAQTCLKANSSSLYKAGQLTVATDSPAYTPWFSANRPSNGKGYESAVAYAVASQLGFGAKHVKWVVEHFDNSYQPGTKPFDFDINEISYTNARAQVVSFSNSYYNVTQSLITLKGSTIIKHHTPAQLKSYLYGDQINTTGLSYIQDVIKPTNSPRVYNTLADAVSALVNKQIQAIVLDTPDAQYMASPGSGEIPGNKGYLVGQFPSNNEYFGMLFTKSNPLVACVNDALTSLTNNGTLKALNTKWLGIYNKVPKIQP